MATIIGIDLGMTNSTAAVVKYGKSIVIPTAEGGFLCPSVVAYTPGDNVLVGQHAKEQLFVDPQNTFQWLKRFIGRRYAEIEEESKAVSYQVIAGPGGNVRVNVPATGIALAPHEITAKIVKKLKIDAENFLGEPIDQVVVSVPAYFNNSQRKATKEACSISGIEVLRLINDQTAAVLAYGLDRLIHKTVLVFNLGGTCNVSILHVDNSLVEVIATRSDLSLGGDEWNERIIGWSNDKMRKNQKVASNEDPQKLQLVRKAAENAKIELSSKMETNIHLSTFTTNTNQSKEPQLRLTRGNFELMTADLVQRCKKSFDHILRDSAYRMSEIDEILLTGGATRIPMVQNLVDGLFQGKLVHCASYPEETGAIGAAIQAAMLCNLPNEPDFPETAMSPMRQWSAK